MAEEKKFIVDGLEIESRSELIFYGKVEISLNSYIKDNP